MRKHPIQNVDTIDGRQVFRANPIVQYAVSKIIGLNNLADVGIGDAEDWEQVIMLCGRSLDSAAELSFVRPETIEAAERSARIDALWIKAETTPGSETVESTEQAARFAGLSVDDPDLDQRKWLDVIEERLDDIEERVAALETGFKRDEP